MGTRFGGKLELYEGTTGLGSRGDGRGCQHHDGGLSTRRVEPASSPRAHIWKSDLGMGSTKRKKKNKAIVNQGSGQLEVRAQIWVWLMLREGFIVRETKKQAHFYFFLSF